MLVASVIAVCVVLFTVGRARGGTSDGPHLQIVLYSVEYSEPVLHKWPYHRWFGERAYSLLAELRDRDTRLVLITLEPPELSVLAYHFKDLYGLDAGAEASARARLVFLTPERRAGGALADAVIADAAVMGTLRDEVRAAKTARLRNLCASPTLDLLGEQLGIPVEEGPFDVQSWGGTSGAKQIFVAAGVPAPRGRPQAYTSVADIVRAATELATANPPAARVIVKLDDPGWGDGLGNIVVDCDELRRCGELVGAADQMALPWEEYLQALRRNGAIVEEYVEDVVCSPSGQAYIAEDGTVTATSMHEQITVDGQYVGCRFAVPAWMAAPIRAALVGTGTALHARGARGTFGIDFVTTAEGQVLAIEINLRKVGPSHVYAYARSATDREPTHYLHRRFHKPDLLDALDPAEAVAALKARGLLFDRSRGTGAILHILGALRTCGYVEITSIANDAEAASTLDRDVQLELLRAAESAARRPASAPST